MELKKLELHSAIASCNSYASFVLSNLPRASIAPWLHAACTRIYFLLREKGLLKGGVGGWFPRALLLDPLLQLQVVKLNLLSERQSDKRY